MSASEALNQHQFVHHVSSASNTIESWHPDHAGSDWAQAQPHERAVYHGSSIDPGVRPTGAISWNPDGGEIKGVYVLNEHRGTGLASELLARARRSDPSVHHSEHLTPAGIKFAARNP